MKTLVEVAGVEPAEVYASFPVSIGCSAVLSEALTEITDRDRQILVIGAEGRKKLCMFASVNRVLKDSAFLGMKSDKKAI